MERVGKPRGLIRYDSLARLQGQRTRVLRPRVLVYSALLVGVIAALFVGLGTRPMLDFTVLRPPGEPFAVLPGGVVSNHVTLRLHNRGPEARRYRLAVRGPADAELITPLNPMRVEGGEQARTEVFVNLPAARVRGGKAPLHIQVYAGRTLVAEQPMTLLGPATP